MIFCARVTPSFGLMARLGVTVGGRVRKSRAVEDQSAPIPGERMSELGREGYERPGSLLARRTRTSRKCSFHRVVKGSLGRSSALPQWARR